MEVERVGHRDTDVEQDAGTVDIQSSSSSGNNKPKYPQLPKTSSGKPPRPSPPVDAERSASIDQWSQLLPTPSNSKLDKVAGLQAAVAELEAKLRLKELERQQLKQEASKLDEQVDPQAVGLPSKPAQAQKHAAAGAAAGDDKRQEKMAALRSKLEGGGSLVDDAMVKFVSGDMAELALRKVTHPDAPRSELLGAIRLLAAAVSVEQAHAADAAHELVRSREKAIRLAVLLIPLLSHGDAEVRCGSAMVLGAMCWAEAALLQREPGKRLRFRTKAAAEGAAAAAGVPSQPSGGSGGGAAAAAAAAGGDGKGQIIGLGPVATAVFKKADLELMSRMAAGDPEVAPEGCPQAVVEFWVGLCRDRAALLFLRQYYSSHYRRLCAAFVAGLFWPDQLGCAGALQWLVQALQHHASSKEFITGAFMQAFSQLPVRAVEAGPLAGQEQLVECVAEMAHPQQLPQSVACGYMRVACHLNAALLLDALYEHSQRLRLQMRREVDLLYEVWAASEEPEAKWKVGNIVSNIAWMPVETIAEWRKLVKVGPAI